jgi:hypothetical protein
MLWSHVMKLSSVVDIKKCTVDRPGGCLVVYSKRATDAVKEDLEKLVNERLLLKLAVLSARTSDLQLTREAADRVLDSAQESNAAFRDVLVLFRLVPHSARGSVPDRFIVTATGAALPGSVSLGDVDAIVALSNQAATYLTRVAPLHATSDVGASLLHEEALEALHSATLDESDIHTRAFK